MTVSLGFSCCRQDSPSLETNQFYKCHHSMKAAVAGQYFQVCTVCDGSGTASAFCQVISGPIHHFDTTLWTFRRTSRCCYASKIPTLSGWKRLFLSFHLLRARNHSPWWSIGEGSRRYDGLGSFGLAILNLLRGRHLWKPLMFSVRVTWNYLVVFSSMGFESIQSWQELYLWIRTNFHRKTSRVASRNWNQFAHQDKWHKVRWSLGSSSAMLA